MIYIAIISHGHEDVINNLSCIDKLSGHEEINIIIKDNLALGILKERYEKCNNIVVLEDKPGLGFGENNNYIFHHCMKFMGANSSDWFLILNPDVDVSFDTLNELYIRAESKGYNFATINLYKDLNSPLLDNNIRKFPALFDFVNSYLIGKNKTIVNKKLITDDTAIDWAAGSFLFIKFNVFIKLNGFDERYFMYCEDIDICWRYSEIFNSRVIYIPHLKAMHDYRKANRHFFSSHFRWHIKSMFVFLLKKKYKNVTAINKYGRVGND